MNSTRRVRNALMLHARQIGWKYPENGEDIWQFCDEKAMNRDMIEYLKEKRASALSLGVRSLRKRKDNIYGIDFTPVYDRDFFPEPIEELRKTAPKKKCITGTTEYEGLFFGRRLLHISKSS
ncbi:unnamed protein product [Anisakis simplex]|uniref:COesterase domain-containing protein n=1 Tax=Anisakis simplex TaxID=6269 RepID=A0A0M3JGM7_ANISI|nr:unnamed protein product [Anisakis simplex]